MKRLFLVLLMTSPAAAAAPEFPPLPTPVTSFGAAVSDGFVYVYGGHSGKPHSYSSATTLGRTYSAHSLFVPWLIWLLLVLNIWFLFRRIQARKEVAR